MNIDMPITDDKILAAITPVTRQTKIRPGTTRVPQPKKLHLKGNTTMTMPTFLTNDDDDDSIDTTGLADTHGGGLLPTADEVVVPPPTIPRKKVLRRRGAVSKVAQQNKLAEVPEGQYYDNYISREISGLSYVSIFDQAEKNAMNVLIEGPTGSGKTTAALAYAALRKRPFYSVSSSSAVEPSQLFGRMLPTGDGKQLAWFDGPVTDIWRYGGVLLINEVNFLPPRISTVLFGALDVRRTLQLTDYNSEIIKAHRPDCWCDLPADECRARWVLVIADMNPDYEGTSRVNRAFLNRFPIRLEWGYDREVEKELLQNPALLNFAWAVRTDDAARNVGVPLSTNMLIEFESIVEGTGSLSFASMNFMAHFEKRDRSFIEAVYRVHADNIESDFWKLGWL